MPLSKKVLLIDDDEDIVSIVVYILSEAGYDVQVHASDHILEEVVKVRPDLVLMDNWLGNQSGSDACKALKSDDTTRHIPVLMFSANSDLHLIAQECLADGYIAKPFDIEHLESVIAAAIDQHSHPSSEKS